MAPQGLLIFMLAAQHHICCCKLDPRVLQMWAEVKNKTTNLVPPLMQPWKRGREELQWLLTGNRVSSWVGSPVFVMTAKDDWSGVNSSVVTTYNLSRAVLHSLLPFGLSALVSQPHVRSAPALACTHLYALRKVFCVSAGGQGDKTSGTETRSPSVPTCNITVHEQKLFCGPKIKQENLTHKKGIGFVVTADLLVWKQE